MVAIGGLFYILNPGELNAFKHLVIEGYDHIVDVHDDESIVTIAYARGFEELGKYLESIPTFEVYSTIEIEQRQPLKLKPVTQLILFFLSF